MKKQLTILMGLTAILFAAGATTLGINSHLKFETSAAETRTVNIEFGMGNKTNRTVDGNSYYLSKTSNVIWDWNEGTEYLAKCETGGGGISISLKFQHINSVAVTYVSADSDSPIGSVYFGKNAVAYSSEEGEYEEADMNAHGSNYRTRYYPVNFADESYVGFWFFQETYISAIQVSYTCSY